jgi:hypothetical protein
MSIGGKAEREKLRNGGDFDSRNSGADVAMAATALGSAAQLPVTGVASNTRVVLALGARLERRGRVDVPHDSLPRHFSMAV